MQEYEIRIQNRQDAPALVTVASQLSDKDAIHSARRIALGRQFEVWRDGECITGLMKLTPGQG